jgi:ecotin
MKSFFYFSFLGLFLTQVSCQKIPADLSKNNPVSATPTPIASEEFHTFDLSVFPPAKEGYKRIHFMLPIQVVSNLFKLEVFAGMSTKVDCNTHILLGDINEKTLEGYGYQYFEVNTEGNIMSTKMFCNEPETTKFVSMQPLLLDYNERLPYVFYVPNTVEIRYRIFETDGVLIAPTD